MTERGERSPLATFAKVCAQEEVFGVAALSPSEPPLRRGAVRFERTEGSAAPPPHANSPEALQLFQ